MPEYVLTFNQREDGETVAYANGRIYTDLERAATERTRLLGMYPSEGWAIRQLANARLDRPWALLNTESRNLLSTTFDTRQLASDYLGGAEGYSIVRLSNG